MYCPEIELGVLGDIMKWTMPGFGPFESWQAEHTVKGGEQLQLADMDIEVLFTPGHSPGHVTYAIDAPAPPRRVRCRRRTERLARSQPALLSGDVLFQGSVGRVDLPGGDWQRSSARSACSMSRFERDTVVYPGTWV